MYEKLEINPNTTFFHGTNADFDRFDEQYKGSNSGWNNTVHGFFFADKKENAKLFGKTIVEARLTALNLIDLRLPSIFNNVSQASVIWEILSGQKLNDRDALSTLEREIDFGEIVEMYELLNSKKANGAFVKAGYDGIISSLGDNENEYAVFKASQIEILSIERPLSWKRSR